MGEQVVVDYGKGKEVAIKEEEVFGIERARLHDTHASGHYQPSSKTKMLNHTRVVKPATEF